MGEGEKGRWAEEQRDGRGRGWALPLSEHEQRVLRQIERQLQQEKGLARPLRVPANPEEAARKAKWAAGAFVAGLVALLASFASSWVIGLVGFLVMVGAAAVLAQCLRRLAQERWGSPSPPGASSPDSQTGRSRGERKWWPGWAPGQHDDEPN